MPHIQTAISSWFTLQGVSLYILFKWLSDFSVLICFYEWEQQNTSVMTVERSSDINSSENLFSPLLLSSVPRTWLFHSSASYRSQGCTMMDILCGPDGLFSVMWIAVCSPQHWFPCKACIPFLDPSLELTACMPPHPYMPSVVILPLMLSFSPEEWDSFVYFPSLKEPSEGTIDFFFSIW